MIPIAKTLVRPAFIGKTHTQVGAPKLLEATQARGIVYIYYNSNNSNNDVYIYIIMVTGDRPRVFSRRVWSLASSPGPWVRLKRQRDVQRIG